jgi:hypothetical protein
MMLAEQDWHPIGTLATYGGETHRIRHRSTLVDGNFGDAYRMAIVNDVQSRPVSFAF